MISIQPKWCKLITNGKKTIEVRKTKPKIETPFKVYIYCTMQGSNEFFQSLKNRLGEYEALSKWNREKWGLKKGKVIGEFICDKITDCRKYSRTSFFTLSCMSLKEWMKYTEGHKGTVWAWHISDLVIYDKPKELREFISPIQCNSKTAKDMLCNTCCLSANFCSKKPKTITRPPQSWCYVEDFANE